jgi:hypothetical protein
MSEVQVNSRSSGAAARVAAVANRSIVGPVGAPGPLAVTTVRSGMDRGQAPRPATAEIALLKEQLEEYKQVAVDARATVAEFETRIASAQPQIESLRSQWKNTQQELEVQKQARMGETARLSERLTSLERELIGVSSEAVALRGTLAKERSAWQAVAVVTGLIAMGILCVVAWWVIRPAPVTDASIHPAVAVLRPPAEVRQSNNAPPPDTHSSLTAALDHLNTALANAPQSKPMENNPPENNQMVTLRKVSMMGQGCTLLWTNNLPSILYGGTSGDGTSLASILNNCAEAVTRLH